MIEIKETKTCYFRLAQRRDWSTFLVTDTFTKFTGAVLFGRKTPEFITESDIVSVDVLLGHGLAENPWGFRHACKNGISQWYYYNQWRNHGRVAATNCSCLFCRLFLRITHAHLINNPLAEQFAESANIGDQVQIEGYYGQLCYQQGDDDTLYTAGRVHGKPGTNLCPYLLLTGFEVLRTLADERLPLWPAEAPAHCVDVRTDMNKETFRMRCQVNLKEKYS